MTEELLKIFSAAIEAADPKRALLNTLRLEANTLIYGDLELDLKAFDELLVVGAGKATAPMAEAAEEILGERITNGIIIVKEGHTGNLLKITQVEASHPLPNSAGVEATARILGMLENAGEKTLVICLISGGASALLVAPAYGLTLDDKRASTEMLLRAGADITELNTVRKHLSGVKGGRLAEAAHPARLLTLIVSDVIGDPLETIASGPTVADPTTFCDALLVVDKYKLKDRLPEEVMRVLSEGLIGELPESPKPGSREFGNAQNLIIAKLNLSLGGALWKAETLGYRAKLLTSTLAGEAIEGAQYLARKAFETQEALGPGDGAVCLLSGGETTVTVTGTGTGGRNQELALAFAIEIAGSKGITMLSAGTDGTDGPTDAAGASVDGQTVTEAYKLGLDAGEFLKENDSYAFFDRLDEGSGSKHHIKTGPTGTNVGDIQIIIVEGPPA
jgi:hydroxypyruvate reductase